MYTQINESIKVGVVFDKTSNSKMRPVWFMRSGRKYTVKEITFSWHAKNGEATIHYFSVTDGSAVYEISFNDKTLNWLLGKVYVE